MTPRGKFGEEGGKPFPDADSTFTLQMELLIDGGMIRFNRKGMEWHDVTKSFVDQEYFSSSDLQVSKSFSKVHFDDKLGKPHPVGAIHKTPRNSDTVGASPFQLVMFTFRAFDPIVGCTGNLFDHPPTDSPTLSSGELEGSRYLVIRQSFGAWSRTIWVDSARGFTIRRYLATHSGNPVTQIDATYKMDGKVGWVPNTWTMTGWLPGPNNTRRLAYNLASQLDSYEINPRLDIEVFRPQFPTGAVVVDSRNPKVIAPGNAHVPQEYLVKSDGSKRTVLPAERLRGASHDELLSTETGKAGLYREDGGSWIWLIAAALMGVIAAGWSIRAYLRHRA
jgi:hypothetical protein